MTGNLVFNAEAHEYRYNGVRVPSVTQIISGAGLIDSQWFTEAAAWRGHVAHKCCELDCKGTLNEKTVDPGAAGYLAAWRDCKRNIGFVADQIEVPQYHTVHGYCGTPDRRGRMAGGSRCVLDLKTGALQKWHKMQLAGYTHFNPIPQNFRRLAVRLFDDGKYSILEYPAADLPGDWAAFIGSLNLQKWKKNNGY